VLAPRLMEHGPVAHTERATVEATSGSFERAPAFLTPRAADVGAVLPLLAVFFALCVSLRRGATWSDVAVLVTWPVTAETDRRPRRRDPPPLPV
jgi:hypothetical protein